MRIPFDRDLAKEAVELKTGRVMMECLNEAHITEWDDPHFPESPIKG